MELNPKPEHILIETSGLALPKPLLKAFDWPDIRSRITVDGVIALADIEAVASGQFANCPDATASISARAITPSTVIRERISGQSKALRRGFGSAKPEVSIKICSGFGLSSIRDSIVGIKSSATVHCC